MRKRIGIAQSLMTLANAGCGFIAISLLVGTSGVDGVERPLLVASSLILLGLFFDTLDGKIARLTNQESTFGGQLDSLSDVITFGVTPALLVKVLLDSSPAMAGMQGGEVQLSLIVALLFLVCAILRLARFNTEKSDEEERAQGFSGLPTPGAAGLIAAIVILYEQRGQSEWLVRMLPYLMPILGLLMVSHMPYSHIGSQLLRGRRPFTDLLRVVFFGMLAAFLLVESIFVGFALYVASGPMRLAWDTIHARGRVQEKLF